MGVLNSLLLKLLATIKLQWKDKGQAENYTVEGASKIKCSFQNVSLRPSSGIMAIWYEDYKNVTY